MPNPAAECPVGVGVRAKTRTADQTESNDAPALAAFVVPRNANKPLCLVPCVLFMAVNNLAPIVTRATNLAHEGVREAHRQTKHPGRRSRDRSGTRRIDDRMEC